MNAFVFDEKPERPAEIVAEIPAGLSSKQELFATIAIQSHSMTIKP